MTCNCGPTRRCYICAPALFPNAGTVTGSYWSPAVSANMPPPLPTKATHPHLFCKADGCDVLPKWAGYCELHFRAKYDRPAPERRRPHWH